MGSGGFLFWSRATICGRRVRGGQECPPYIGLRLEWDCRASIRGRQDGAGRISALQVAKNYQKSGVLGLHWNYKTMQNTVVQLDAEY